LHLGSRDVAQIASSSVSVIYLEGRTVLGPRFAVMVNPRRGDIGVPEPFLNLRDIGLMVERIGGGRRPQRMQAAPASSCSRADGWSKRSLGWLGRWRAPVEGLRGTT
jgi:hypothetical protein